MKGYFKLIIIGLLLFGLFTGLAAGAPNITDSNPDTNPYTVEDESQTFDVTINETANITWMINGTSYEIDENTTLAQYSNDTASPGIYNITAKATNPNGSNQVEWTWTVNESLSINDSNPSNNPDTIEGESIEFNITTNQNCDITWKIEGSTVQLNTSTTFASYVNNTATNGTYNVTAIADNLNGTVQNEWAWTVLDNDLKITDYSPQDNPETTTAESQDFSINTNQLCNITWYINGSEVQNNTNVTDIYTNNSANAGIYNVTAVADNPNGTVQREWTWTVTNVPLDITDYSPDDNTLDIIVDETQNFSVQTNQNCTIEWFVDGSNKQTNSSTNTASFSTTQSSAGTYNISSEASNPNGTEYQNWTLNVHEKTYFTGNRIWDEDEDMSTTYKWTAETYSGFYYDLDTGLSSETMTINDIDRNIDDDELEYSTKPIETDFEFNDFGSYQVIGFMAERYFAGYLESDGEDGTSFVDEDISVMADGQLSKVLMDDDERKSVFSGSALVLEDGYRLNIVEVDLQGDSVLIRLTKDGDEVDTGIVSADDTYTYENDLGSTDDVPIIAVNFAEVFRGAETNAVFVEGIFQISDEYTEIDEGDNYGKMQIEDVSSSQILMENDDSISLDEGDTIDIMGNLKIVVADDDTLRFAPFVDRTEPGTYEVRGTVFEDEEGGIDVSEWTPLNFEGFYYDIDEGLQTESLNVTNRNDRNINDGNLVYKTIPAEVEFEYNDFGSYEVIGFMAEKYFAGFIESDGENGTSFADEDISLMSDGQLSKVLIDSDERNSIYTGSSLILEEGYTLNIVEVDIDGDNVLIELKKGGEQVDQDIVSADDEYIYEKDLGSTDDVPIIAVNFAEVFRGQEANAVFVEGIFQISDEYTEVDEGDNYGKMNVETVTSSRITMENDDDINLDEGDTINVMGNIKFKVADDNTLRYYPFVEVTTRRGESLNLDIPDTAVTGEPFTITVTSRGAAVEDATIKLDDENIGETSTDGTFEYTPEDTGTYAITAEKQGYVSASGEIDIDIPEEAKEKMSISVEPKDIFEGDVINVTVATAIGNEPIEDADVFFDQNLIGKTSEDGIISYTVTEPGFHKITVSKDRYREAEENIEVLELMADFEFSNLQINPSTVSPGETVRISADATNTGEVAGDYNIELVVNGSVVDSKQINLDVGENTTVQFNHSEEQTGNYSVEIGGLTGSFNVEEGASIVLYSIIGVIGAIAVGLGYMFTKGGWTIEMIRGRITELIGRSR